MRPNILLILADQFRGDCLGINGHPDVKTPNLDSLAGDGILFENAYSPCPSCIAARAALMTGMSPLKNGRTGYKDGVAWDYPETLAGNFTRAGYQTRMCGKMHVHPLRNNLGYEEVELHDGYLHYYRQDTTPYYENQKIADDYSRWLSEELGASADHTESGIDCNSWVARPWPYPEKYHPTNWVTDRAIDFLRKRDRSRPFFLTASYVRPHPPYDPPRDFWDMYIGEKLSPPHVGDWADPLTGTHSITDISAPSDETLRHMAMAGYYGCISHLDNQIGRLLIALFDAGALSDTVILFCSDHGEMLFDHNLCRKSLPYLGSARVPLLIKGPGIAQGVRETKLASLEDVMPTLLSVAGVPVPETCDGLDLLSECKREFLYGTHDYGALTNRWLVSAEEKFICYPEQGREQYFRLDEDPYEMKDRVSDPVFAGQVSKLRERMDGILRSAQK